MQTIITNIKIRFFQKKKLKKYINILHFFGSFVLSQQKTILIIFFKFNYRQSKSPLQLDIRHFIKLENLSAHVTNIGKHRNATNNIGQWLFCQMDRYPERTWCMQGTFLQTAEVTVEIQHPKMANPKPHSMMMEKISKEQQSGCSQWLSYLNLAVKS